MLRQTAFLAGLLLASAAASAQVVPANNPPVQPDIIVMLADDYGAREAQDLPSSNGVITRKVPPSATLNIDALAAAGVVYQTATAQPACVQARTMLMSGLYNQRQSVGGQQANGPQPPSSVVMIPEMLKPLGYRSVLIGKWHLGLEARSPGRQGFDYWYGFTGKTPRYEGHDTAAPLVEQIGTGKLRYLQNVGNVTATLGTRMVEILNERATTRALNPTTPEQPLFAYVAWTAPHDPLGGTLAQRVKEMDDQIGRIVAAAKPGTLFFFAGDNGRFQPGNAPLKGAKYSIQEGGVRVPFYVRWDGHLPAGVVRPGIVSLVDIAATVVAAAGGTLTHTDGINLFTEAGVPADRAIFYDAMYDSPDYAVRVGRWKYYATGTLANPRLYDISVDPTESLNRWVEVKATSPIFAESLRKRLLAFKASLNDLP